MDNPAPWRVLDSPDQAGQPRPSRPSASSAAFAVRVAIIVALLAAGAIVAVAAALAMSAAGGQIAVSGGSLAASASPDAAFGGELTVEVSGAVRNPGVYRLPAGARVADAIDAAGGYGPRVDAALAESQLDLAARLIDGATVVVPSRDDPPPTPGGADASGGLVDLNAASAGELDALPGIGPVTAQKILDARKERRFGSVDELRERGIVGEKTFERLRDLVTVR